MTIRSVLVRLASEIASIATIIPALLFARYLEDFQTVGETDSSIVLKLISKNNGHGVQSKPFVGHANCSVSYALQVPLKFLPQRLRVSDSL